VLVLGIDPGSQVTGLCAVRRVKSGFQLVRASLVRTDSDDPMPHRLLVIHTGVAEAIAELRPDAVAIEKIFAHKSAESALRLGQARGVALVACAQAGLPIFEYNTMVAKQTVGGSGRAGKAEVARMVERLLGLRDALPLDASDAAALAITHHTQGAFAARLAGGAP
jgi:crossover junction endodeoxyribonuclease RuvC